ncbi:proteasome subunit beta [Pseudonocardia acidicola]|uniref:Proteasome subunit beta n=1 Tax=Pseudonocardia acidicola TaxID=2724939 RepID=A0ABX1SCQ9_9PSEU|nr:proteasome subunit beta [Pseudonocardia acidicola]NMH99354.1 proteasome subunit beta [Pseudonocardia acidicola]
MDPRPPVNNGIFAGHLGAYFAPGSPSFTDFVAATAPHLLPGRVPEGLVPRAGHAGGAVSAGGLDVPHGTTIVALTFADGVVLAGDRRATSGNVIAQRDIEKVFITDSYSSVGIAGSAGIALEMVRLFTVDLEHYEKIEGVPLSFDGKANKLAGMLRQNLGAALQGFVVVPLFVGYDTEAPDPEKAGRIVTYDPTGGRYDEWLGYHSVGSGSVFAKSSLKKLHDPKADKAKAVRTALEALYDAADDDTATGGPDLIRKIFPVVVSITGVDGAVRHTDDEIAEITEQLLADRAARPGG